MVRRGAGLNANQARWKLRKKCQDVTTLLPADHHPTGCINAVNLKN